MVYDETDPVYTREYDHVVTPRYSRKKKKHRRKRSTARYTSLNREPAIVEAAPRVDTQSKVVTISMDDAWDCAPSIAWILMYFVLVGMVAVSMRFYPDPLFSTAAAKTN